MNRVLVIGGNGSGKTTFSRLLADKLDIPAVHLDKIFWYGTWQSRAKEEFDALLQKELEKENWIIDGNFTRTLPHRLSYCDTVFFFDLPRFVCLWGVTQRIFQNRGKTRKDMGGDCPERFDKQKWSLYRNILTFNRQHRKDYYRLLAGADHANVVVFRSRRQAEKFLKGLE